MIYLEWRKAIIILIISFLSLNLFLLANWWANNEPTGEFTLTHEQQQEISELLSQKGVKLDTQIPAEGIPQAFLEVAYQKVDEKKAVENFLGKDANPKIEELQEGKSYSLGSKQLIIMENGIISFFNKEEAEVLRDLNRDEAVEEARAFVEDHGGLPEDAVLNSVTYDPKSRGFLIGYVRKYDDFFMANSYIDVVVTPAGVRSYYQLWLHPVGYTGKRRSVISPLTAILRVISEVNSGDEITITQIQQGFYTKFYDAEQWQAAPVWKIQLNHQDVYYVNAYTGELEQ